MRDRGQRATVHFIFTGAAMHNDIPVIIGREGGLDLCREAGSAVGQQHWQAMWNTEHHCSCFNMLLDVRMF